MIGSCTKEKVALHWQFTKKFLAIEKYDRVDLNQKTFMAFGLAVATF